MSQSTTPDLTRHPLSAFWPDMPVDDFTALVASVAEHGIREPIVLLDGMVLDGWHRYRAATEAGQPIRSTKYTGDDPVSFVIDANGHRRHLTAEQKAACVLQVREWAPRGPIRGRRASTPS